MLFVPQPKIARALSPIERRIVTGALSHCGVAPRELCRRAAAEAILVPRELSLGEVRGPRSLVAHIALTARADGIALGRHVFVRSALFGPEGSVPIELVAHEVTHVAQYMREGTLRFCLSYVSAYALGRASGLDAHAAYLAIPYEIEARAVAASLLV
jgi:hypothetical protein